MIMLLASLLAIISKFLLISGGNIHKVKNISGIYWLAYILHSAPFAKNDRPILKISNFFLSMRK